MSGLVNYESSEEEGDREGGPPSKMKVKYPQNTDAILPDCGLLTFQVPDLLRS